MGSAISTLAGIGMAVGPPLIYVDQAYSIIKKKDSTGFSWDVCGVLLIANIIRIFFWLGERFEIPLLCQSILLIISQLLLLSLCLHYAPHVQIGNYAPLSPLPSSPQPQPRPPGAADNEQGPGQGQGRESSDYLDRPHGHDTTVADGAGEIHGEQWKEGRRRPFNFWQWEGLGTYLEFLAGLILVLGVLQVILGRWTLYIDALGFVALTIESTLPIPQFISNYKRKSTYGLRASTLAGWLFGDLFKTGYFFLRGNPIQFKVTAIMTVCWDLAVVGQRFMYGTAPPRGTSIAGDDEMAQDSINPNDEARLTVGNSDLP